MKITPQEFRADETKREKLHELLRHPVMHEAIRIVLEMYGPSLPKSIDAAAIQGAFISGVYAAFNGLEALTEMNLETALKKDEDQPLPPLTPHQIADKFMQEYASKFSAVIPGQSVCPKSLSFNNQQQ